MTKLFNAFAELYIGIDVVFHYAVFIFWIIFGIVAIFSGIKALIEWILEKIKGE